MKPHVFRLSLLGLAIAVSIQGCASKRPLPPSAPVESQLRKLAEEKKFGIPVYLKKIDGVWTASATGDLTDPNTERVKFYPNANWAAEPYFESGALDGMCGNWTPERRGEKYSRCTSNLYSRQIGMSVGRKVFQGVLTLGIATLADQVNDNASVFTALDLEVFGKAIQESGAVEIARKNEPLWEYRARFAAARQSTDKLKAFIAEQEGRYDPDQLVEQARQKLPLVAQDEAKAAAAKKATADLLERERAARVAQRAKTEAYVRALRVGDEILVITDPPGSRRLHGMVIEIKGPLLFVQWKNREPRMEWIQSSIVTPPY